MGLGAEIQASLSQQGLSRCSRTPWKPSAEGHPGGQLWPRPSFEQETEGRGDSAWPLALQGPRCVAAGWSVRAGVLARGLLGRRASLLGSRVVI